MRTSAAVLAVAGLFTAVVVAVAGAEGRGSTPQPSWLPVPEEVTATVTDRGDPVWVVPHPDGEVSVLSSVNPHLDILVVWCEQSRTFVEEGPASMFDEHGRYLGGPAPTGLQPYEVERRETSDGAAVLGVGARLPAPGRDIAPSQPAGPMCDWTEEERVAGARRHDLPALYGAPAVPEDVGPSAHMQLLDARLHADGEGGVRMCTPRAEEGCPRAAPPVRTFFHGHGHLEHLADMRGSLDGPMLGRRGSGGFHDVAMPWIPIAYQRFEHVGEPPDLFAASAVGRIAALEPEGDGWVVVLDRPVLPEGQDADSRVTLPASDRWPVADDLHWWDEGVVPPAEPEPGSRLPQRVFSTDDVAARLAAGEELHGRLEMDRQGEVRWAELLAAADVDYLRREGLLD